MNHKLSLALAAALFALPLAASAQDEAVAAEAAAAEVSESVLSWNLMLTSDYVFRGVSQTNEAPALQGGLDVAFFNGLYVGIWGSNVEFAAGGPDIELDTYAGWNNDLSDEWNLDLMLVRYNYFGERDDYGTIEYSELVGKLAYNEMLTFTLGYTNDIYALGENSFYYNLAGSFDLGNDVSFGAGLGLSTFDSATGVEDYLDWSLGLSRSFGPVHAALTYYGTDSDGEYNFGNIADDRIVLSFKIGGDAMRHIHKP